MARTFELMDRSCGANIDNAVACLDWQTLASISNCNSKG